MSQQERQKDWLMMLVVVVVATLYFVERPSK
jgi:hypothetical protein